VRAQGRGSCIRTGARAGPDANAGRGTGCRCGLRPDGEAGAGTGAASGY
jgi:hypothetical protein